MESKRYLKMVNKALDKYLPPAGDEPKAVHKAMRYCVFPGGKRIRPLIVMESAKVCGAARRDALVAACAVELVHTYSLVHDDLPAMDDDDFRRGKRSCHKAFGEACAILTGDALLTLAFNIIARHMTLPSASRAAAELSDAIGTYGMVGGQAADIENKTTFNAAAAITHINRLKTARLFEACAKLGAIAAGTNARRIKAMALYGRGLGMAFQAVDDLLDGDGCVKLYGAVRARSEAHKLIAGAKRPLDIFGKRASGLRSIADSVLERIE